jgi:predicted Ser/Thr protein kinase
MVNQVSMMRDVDDMLDKVRKTIDKESKKVVISFDKATEPKDFDEYSKKLMILAMLRERQKTLLELKMKWSEA